MMEIVLIVIKKKLKKFNTGFRSTLIWEDDYEICITDNYESSYNGITSTAKVRYKADKSSNMILS